MFEIFHTIFKYKEKESPDKLGLYPESVHIKAMPERRYLWTSRILVILACISICVNMMLALTVYLLVPQKSVYPRLLKINKYFSQLELVERAEKSISATDLLAEQHITDYIILRNSITNDYDELISRWGKNEIIYWYSSRSVYESFFKNEVRVNLRLFKEKELQRFVKVEWVRPMTMGLWQAQYITMDVVPGVEKVDTRIWRVAMRIAFERVTNAKKEDLIKNPFGFIVKNYSLSYVGTPESSPHYLERAREMAERSYN